LTENLRIGTAGILFPYYSPAKAAWDFHLLEAAYPGRIDAGFCAGLALPSLHEDLLDGRPNQRDPVRYQQRVGALISHLRRTPQTVEKIDFETTWAGADFAPPTIWVHGNGRGTLECAFEHHLNWGLSIFHLGHKADPVLAQEFRQRFEPSPQQPKPSVALAVAGVCAESNAAAERLHDHSYGSVVQANIVGDPQRWQCELACLQERYQPDLIVVLDLCRHYPDRLAMYTLLAEAVGLPPAAA
jgi:alkanesulfonate monooxygenase SsuD/methylene tetrahydromethanopterin reductase-like flavin-dependent oxidoreductase (luciferase family)